MAILGLVCGGEIKTLGRAEMERMQYMNPVDYEEHIMDALCQQAGTEAVRKFVKEYPFAVERIIDKEMFSEEKIRVKFAIMPELYYIGLLKMQWYLKCLEHEVEDNVKGGAELLLLAKKKSERGV